MLDLRFTASQPGYTVNTTTTNPASPVDTLVVAPMTGVFPWLDDQARGKRYSPDYAVSRNLEAGQPVTVKLPLNAVYRFDQPGHYSVHVVTQRVYSGAVMQGAPLTMASNEVAFEILPMAAEEDAQRAESLAKSIREAATMQVAQRMAEELDWLAGEPSTRMKLALFLHPKNFYPFSVDVSRGLWVARDRALVIEELGRALDDPAQPVSSLLGPAVGLKARLEVPFDPAALAAPLPTERIKAEYIRRLAATLPRRTGDALIDAARTVFVELARAGQSGGPQFAAAREIIVTHFGEVNEYNVDWLLNSYGSHLLDARIVPALKQILDQQSNPILNGERTAALKQLMKLAPTDGRLALIREVCAVNTTLLQSTSGIPFQTLPETDECLWREIKTAAAGPDPRHRLDWGVEIAAHFASPAIYEHLLSLYRNPDANLTKQSQGYLLAYLVRWDAERGLRLLDAAVPAGSAAPDPNLIFALAQAYSPPQLAFWLKRLETAPPELASQAAWQLSQHAPTEDRALLAARLERWRAEWKGREIPAPEARLEAELTEGAIRGNNWQASESEATILRGGCVSAECKSRMAPHP